MESDLKRWKIYVISLNFKLKQHLIYIVVMILVAILLEIGFYLVFLVPVIYVKRFPKTYGFYFLSLIIAFGWLSYRQQEVIFKINDEKVHHQATVLEIKRQTEERQTAIIKLDSAHVYLTYEGIEPKLIPGDEIEVNGILRIPNHPTVPHQFDFKNYLKTLGIELTLYSQELEVIGQSYSVWKYQYLIIEWIQENYPILTATYLQAFFVGVRDGIDSELVDAYQKLGVIHIFAISGLHVNLLVNLIGYCFKRIGMIQEILNFVIIGLLLIFIVITGGSASVIRAGLMTSFAILNRQYKWQFSSLDIFSMVFIFNFILNPLNVYQIGFIYSYWITFVLIISQNFLTEFSSFKKMMFFPFLAQIAALPIHLFLAYEVNLMAYLMNLLVLPLVTNLIIPLLLMTLIIPPTTILTEIILQLFESLHLFFANQLNIQWIFGQLSFSIVMFLMFCLLLTGWFYERQRKRSYWLVLIILFVLILEGQRLIKPETKLTFLDVGQGDSMVIQSPYQSCTVIVDTGGNFSFTGEAKSIFSQTLEAYLLGEGIREIDYLILTHQDFDHTGEAIPLMERFPIKTLILSEAKISGKMEEIIEIAHLKKIEIKQVKTNDRLKCSNQTYTFIHPPPRNLDSNDDSLVMTLEINAFNALLTGDIGMTVEPYILNEYSLNHLDVYKVAHHGSKFSNSKTFLETLNPTYAVVSAGRNNIYGHPSLENIEIMSDLGIPLLSTQEQGSIQFKINKKGYRIFSNPIKP